MDEQIDRSTIVGQGLTEGERQDNSSARDMLAGWGGPPPRTSDLLDWSDSLELRARITEGKDSKSADLLRASARRWRADQALIAAMRGEIQRLKALVATLVDGAKGPK